MKLLTKALILGSVLVLPMAFVTPLMALAHAEESTTTESRDADKAEIISDRAAAKLSDAKKRVCENRAKNITKIMANSVKRAQHQGNLFMTIAERVKTFYVNQGKTVANYDQLVAAVDAAKATLDADMATLSATEFSCSSDDPKGSIEEFKAAHKKVIEDLRALRTAVKNLIVGVRSAQGGGNE